MKSFNQERRWVFLFSISVVLLTLLPYLGATSNSSAVFTGFVFGVEDGNSYIAKMLSGANGAWLFHSPYTSMPQSGALLYSPYLLLGKLLGPGAQHSQLVALFHVFRSVSIVLLCFATYDFVSLWLKNEAMRRLALVMATLGSGLGWVLLLFRVPNFSGSIPLDFYSPETFGFLAVFSIPHLVLARALLLWALVAYLRPSFITNRLLIGVLWLTIAGSHLITAAVGIVLVVLHFAYAWVVGEHPRTPSVFFVKAQQIIPIAVGVAPVLLFNTWIYFTDGYLQAWAAQNQILSPHPLHYLVAYGWLLPFVYLGWRALSNAKTKDISFLIIWLFALPVLLYSPVGLQRRLAEGAWVMLIVLALATFDTGTWAKRRRELWLFAMAFPGTLILLLGAWQTAQSPLPPVFRSGDEVAAFEQLRLIAHSDAVVLSAYQTGNTLPAWVPVRVVFGHGSETPEANKLADRIQDFYRGRTADDPRLELLQQHQVGYVFWGPEEQLLGSWEPMDADFLVHVLTVGEYQIYRVLPEAIR